MGRPPREETCLAPTLSYYNYFKYFCTFLKHFVKCWNSKPLSLSLFVSPFCRAPSPPPPHCAPRLTPGLPPTQEGELSKPPSVVLAGQSSRPFACYFGACFRERSHPVSERESHSESSRKERATASLPPVHPDWWHPCCPGRAGGDGGGLVHDKDLRGRGACSMSR